jgi:hypothetical protein
MYLSNINLSIVSLVSNGASGKTYEEIVKSLIPDTEIKKRLPYY